MRVWVTGANGQVGRVLLEELCQKGIDCFGSSHAEIDIADAKAVDAAIQGASHIINAAGFTRVDPAETYREDAYLANVRGPELLAKAAKKANVRLIHISTDYVFDGTLDRPYREDDEPRPVNWYGVTKREGEIRVMQNYPDACIVRVSWVFGGSGRSHYASSILEAIQEQREIRFVDDQKGSPTYAFDFAKALIDLLDESGIYHYCNRGCSSKYAFACEILRLAKEKNYPVICEKIVPIRSSQFSSLAKRPLYTPLDTSKIEKKCSIRSWQEGLDEFFSRIPIHDLR